MLRRFVLATLLLCCAAPHARADSDYLNFSAGPVLYYHWGHGLRSGFAVGLEAGAGWGPMRMNLGHSWFGPEMRTYLVAEPWFLVGYTAGASYGYQTGFSPMLGIWEGTPIVAPQTCDEDMRDDYGLLVTWVIGYHFEGSRDEVYLSVKAGRSQALNWVCFGGLGSGGLGGF